MKRIVSIVIILVSVLSAAHAESRVLDIAATDSTPTMCIYIPDVDDSISTYPILYLFHGIRGNHYGWRDKGNIQYVADSLIENQLIEPIIIVMPYGFGKLPEEKINRIFSRWTECATKRFEKGFPKIIAKVESEYKVSQERDHRAIAGLSIGARQANNLVEVTNSQYAGYFSPVIWMWDYPQKGNNRYYWVCAGDKDLFLVAAKRIELHAKITQLPLKWRYLKGGHAWDVWYPAAIQFLRETFTCEENGFCRDATAMDSVGTTLPRYFSDAE